MDLWVLAYFLGTLECTRQTPVHFCAKLPGGIWGESKNVALYGVMVIVFKISEHASLVNVVNSRTINATYMMPCVRGSGRQGWVVPANWPNKWRRNQHTSVDQTPTHCVPFASPGLKTKGGV